MEKLWHDNYVHLDVLDTPTADHFTQPTRKAMNTEVHIEVADKKFPATQQQLTAFQKMSERMGVPKRMSLLLAGQGCIMFEYDHITIGIETDGYTHS